jgi:hypothetical protein
VTITGLERWIYLFNSYFYFGGMQSFFIPIALGTYAALSILGKNSKTKFIFLLLTLLFLYSIYPVFAGQFWPYHWMPFAYFGCLCVSLLVLPIRLDSNCLYKRIIPLITFIIFLLVTIRPADGFMRQLLGHPVTPPKAGRVDEIASFLKEHLRSGDKVQPLDWTGGAVHGMLISKAVLATSYLYDYHFYHHVSKPYIQRIRKRFINQLEEEKPRYVINMYEKPRPRGADTTTEFAELQEFIDEHYVTVYKGNGFDILEKL